MSWGYWGIVGGLAVMLATFFLCLEILRPNWSETGKGAAEGQGEQGDRSSTTRHAA
jgi:hypothetical protein